MSSQASEKSVMQLLKVESITDLDGHIETLHQRIQKTQAYWQQKQKEYQEQYGSAEHPAVLEAGNILKFLETYLLHKLEEVKGLEDQFKEEALKLIIPFNSEGGIDDFLSHFFQLGRVDGNLEYTERDPFEKETHVLYDVYKIKQTIACVDKLLKTIGNSEKAFPSRFSGEEKEKILKQLKQVLKVLFTKTIHPDHQKALYPKLNLSLLSGKKILERRQANFFYCYPHVIEKYDYRNLFFLVYFRNGLRMPIGGEARDFRYNYIHFEVLKQEFLAHWLASRLKDNPAKQQIYENYKIDERTIASWIEEDPSKEIPLLKQLPLNCFNNLVAEVNEQVEDELKADVPSLSEKHEELGGFRKGLKKIKELTTAPLEKLKEMVVKEEAAPPPVEDIPTEMQEPAEEEAVEEEDTEPRLVITLLSEKQIPYYYLSQTVSKYKGMLSLFRIKMGNDYDVLSKLVNRLMNAFSETPSMIRRRTPKHDCALPYLIQYQQGSESEDYLFILGAEAKTKHKGMGYSVGDEYTYTAYFVFATAEPNEEEYGEEAEEKRVVSGREFHEYKVSNRQVQKKVMEFAELIRQKEFPND